MQIDPDKDYRATIQTDKGTIEVNLHAEHAPKTVNNFVFLTREGYYDGISFHRVIDNFMIQGGGMDADMNEKTASNLSFSFDGYVDTTPDPFSFTDQTGVALNTAITSNAITVSGIDAAANISVSGGQYSIDSGAFTSAAGMVNNGQNVRVRVTSSSSGSTTTAATLTIGGVSDSFDVTTAASAAPRAYVANSGSGTVSVIDTSTNLVVDTITVGGGPYATAAHPGQNLVLVTNTADEGPVLTDGFVVGYTAAEHEMTRAHATECVCLAGFQKTGTAGRYLRCIKGKFPGDEKNESLVVCRHLEAVAGVLFESDFLVDDLGMQSQR